MTEQRKVATVPAIVGIAVVAAAIGFGAARGLGPSAPESQPEASPTLAEVPAQAGTADELKIPDAYLAAADISIEPVAAGSVGAEILAPATVVARPGSEAVIVAKASGTVSRLNRRLGEAVRAGDALALVDSLDAATMAADRRVARTRADLARRAFEREDGLYRQGVTPRQDMEAARAALDVADAEARRADAVARAAHVVEDGQAVAVVSPIAGTVALQRAVLGAFVAPDAELFHVAAPGAIQVEASVTAADTRRIAPGGDATILPRSGTPIPAKVLAVSPAASAESGAATVVLAPEDGAAGLVIGEGVQVRLHAQAGAAEGVIVPEDAVQNLDGRDTLFVRTAQGFVPRPVRVGARSGGLAQVLSGVAAGERIATRNAFLLKAEAKKNAGEPE